MAKKIKVKHELTAEEKKAEEEQKQKDAEKVAAGIQDEFQARGFELVEWVHERQNLVLGFLGAVVVGGLLFGVYTAFSASRNEDSSASLIKAFEAFEAPIGEAGEGDKKPEDGPRFKDAAERNKAARALFEQTYSTYSSTGAGAIASLYVGHIALRQGDADGAAKAYQDFLNHTPAKDPLRYAGLLGLAAALEAKGDKAGAIKKLEDLVNLADKVEEDAALLELGRLYKATGDVAKAKAALERIARDFPDSSRKSRADELLAGLDMPAPAAAPSGDKADKADNKGGDKAGDAKGEDDKGAP